MMRLLFSVLIACALIAPADAGHLHKHRLRADLFCAPIYEPGVGTYRICAPAPRRYR